MGRMENLQVGHAPYHWLSAQMDFNQGYLSPSQDNLTGYAYKSKNHYVKFNPLLKKLEEFQDGFTETALPNIDVTLIDGGLLIHSFLSAIGKITSYGKLARNLLTYVCRSKGNEIHVLFDTSQAMSLKESERKLCGADDSPLCYHWSRASTQTELCEALQSRNRLICVK